jgi:hypothetical protein
MSAARAANGQRSPIVDLALHGRRIRGPGLCRECCVGLCGARQRSRAEPGAADRDGEGNSSLDACAARRSWGFTRLSVRVR